MGSPYSTAVGCPESRDEMKQRKDKSQRQFASAQTIEPNPGLSPVTPQYMAEEFNGYYAKKITEKLNNFAYRQNDPEVARLYITWQQMVASWLSITTENFPEIPKLPDIPALIGTDYYAGLIHLRDYCTETAKKVIDEATQPKADTDKNVSAEAKAMAILIDHPDWSDTRIAKEAGIYRTTLYGLPKFVKARRLLKEQGKKFLPRGNKDGETGNMEAWEK